MTELVTSGSVGGMASNGCLYPEADHQKSCGFVQVAALPLLHKAARLLLAAELGVISSQR